MIENHELLSNLEKEFQQGLHRSGSYQVATRCFFFGFFENVVDGFHSQDKRCNQPWITQMLWTAYC